MYKAACRGYIAERTYYFYVRAECEGPDPLDGVTDDVLVYAGKIDIICTERFRSKKYEVVKQTPYEENGWTGWDVKTGNWWIGICDPRLGLRERHPVLWDRLQGRKAVVCREVGRRGEGVMRTELEWVMAAGAADLRQ